MKEITLSFVVSFIFKELINSDMAENLGEFYIKIAQLTIILIILSYFLYRRFKDRIAGFSWFIFLFSMATTQAITEIILFFTLTPDVVEANPQFADLKEIHIIPYAIGLFVLFLYCEAILNSKPNNIRFGIACALLGSYIAVYFVQLGFNLAGFNLQADIPAEYRLYRVIFNVFQSMVLAEALYMFIQDYRRVENQKLRRISLVMAIGVIIAFVFSLFKIPEYWILEYLIPGIVGTFGEILFYGAISFGILFGILAIEFIFNPFYVYLLPTRINKVIVIDDSGLLLYAVRVGKEAPDIIEHTLLSGTLTAMKMLLSETTGTKSDLQKVSFRDKYLIVAENNEKSISTIIIADRDSYMLQTAAAQFIDAFCIKFGSYLEQFDGSIGCFDDATDLVKRIFPFVPPEEIIKEDAKDI